MSPGDPAMDIETVCSILTDLDSASYHTASEQRQALDDVWPPQLEESFIEAVSVFAPVGQKKYWVEETRSDRPSTELIGRNDIISRFIFMKTNLFRTRKQVSSHIQVWAHCKKPPSGRDMPADEFERLQVMIRQYYSRRQSDHRQCKKKGRRVVSTGSAPAADRMLARSALSIYMGESSPALAASSTPGERKRDSLWLDDSPAKRCRRVVSEMSPLDLGSFRKRSEDTPEMLPVEPHGIHSHWRSSHSNALFDVCTAVGGPQTTSSQPLPQNTPLLAHPAMLVQSLDLPMGASHVIYDLGISSPVDPSVAVFAATIAAMSGFEGGCASPAMDSSKCAAEAATLAPGVLLPHALNGLPPADRGHELSFATSAISAFASATCAADSPSRLPPHHGHGLAGDPFCSAPARAAGTAVRFGEGHASAFLDHFTDGTSGDVYTPLPPLAAWGHPDVGDDAAYEFRLAESDIFMDASVAGRAAFDLRESAAAVATSTAPSTSSGPAPPCTQDAPSTLTNSAAHATGGPQPWTLSDIAEAAGQPNTGSSATTEASDLSADRTDTTGEPASSPTATGVPECFAAERADRIHSRIADASCDPGLPTGRGSSESSLPSGSSRSSPDGDDGSIDWSVIFAQYLQSIG
ncbi:hypothetical protein LPJ61_000226 [Coemansia biformis]|uniref:TEA domain-containing protein n=1 Tax=Coemansia biformis TaxID=1286918 RepID=A0A9W7YC33_9FUNG|nr:hypothetical protein LPJ61_000226 [Coemansia biformis]